MPDLPVRGVRSVKAFCSLLFLLLTAASLFGQTGTIRGTVTDESGAFVAGANVSIANPSGVAKHSPSAEDGSYSIAGLPWGEYIVEASAPQLVLREPVKVNLKSRVTVVNLQLQIAETKQEVTVEEHAAPTVTTESSENASALTVQGKDLQSLGDDPEDLAADLQALAGPSAGPNGGSVYIDGFSGGEMPSKQSIREVRINQNPFSPEYDTLGYGRIEILTKPGAEAFHAMVYNNFGDSFWNSRNPYAAEKAPFLLDEYGGTAEGRISGKASFFVAVDGARINNGAVINGTTLDPNTLSIIDPYTQVFVIPQRRIIVSPRIDYQLTSTDTITVRYSVQNVDIQHTGIGGFNLVSTGFHNHGLDNTVQFANTKIFGANAVHETRFQFERSTISSISDDFSPQINVLNAFTGGGAQVGSSHNALDTFELQHYWTITHDKHTWHFGARVRAATLDNISPIDFGGTFLFSGGLAPELNPSNQPILSNVGSPVLVNIDSIESYRRTLLFEREGFSPAQIRALGGGASQFTLNAGNPSTSANQEDVGAFVNDDWRVKRNLTVNLGLRWEGQTNIHDWTDFAPRLGLAWAPGAGKPRSNVKTVVRAGFGMFYQRFDISSVLTAERYNGIVQQQYVTTNPDFFPAIPSASSLATASSQQTVERLSPNLHSPYLMESALSIERQLPAHTTLALTYVNSHSPNQFLTDDINAPLPGTYNPQVPGSGVYPLGTSNALFQVGNAGRYNQNEFIVNVNARVNESISLFGSYVYNRALSNTDYAPPPRNTDFNPTISYGAMGVGSFPANPYSRVGEYGPAITDIPNEGTFGGSIAAKWGFSFNPLLVVESGAPFNITVGQDLYGDTLFNGRPGIAVHESRPGLVATSYGLLDPNPIPGEAILPRNFGRGPGIVLANLRVSKTFSFGPHGEGSAPAMGGGGPRTQAGPFGNGGATSGGAKTGRDYNLTLSMSARNVINHNNPGPIIGNITSPLFGKANQPYGASSLGGTGFSEAADNRRLELQLRFSF
jgi:Carboxypeptidase regulatory-like domain